MVIPSSSINNFLSCIHIRLNLAYTAHPHCLAVLRKAHDQSLCQCSGVFHFVCFIFNLLSFQKRHHFSENLLVGAASPHAPLATLLVLISLTCFMYLLFWQYSCWNIQLQMTTWLDLITVLFSSKHFRQIVGLHSYFNHREFQ